MPMPSDDEKAFDAEEWRDFYGEVEEELPPNAPIPYGRPVKQYACVDSDYAGCALTRRSRTGLLMLLNRSPVDWLSKKQAKINHSTFASEFDAMKTAAEKIVTQRYKLGTMGIRIDGPAEIRCDNMGVVFNTSRPESVLKKKMQAFAYHYVRELPAMGVLQVCYVPTKENLADELTKIQTGLCA